MGRPAEVLGHRGCLAPAPQNLPDSTPSVSIGEAPILPSIADIMPNVPYERRTRRNGRLGQHLSGAPSLHRELEPMVDMVSPHTQMLASQGSALTSSLLAPVANGTAPVFLTQSGHGTLPGPNGAIRARPKSPRVKVCLLSAGGRDIPVLQDTGLTMQGLARVRNIDPEYIITRTSEKIDVAFDEFFDPTDIHEGGLLILILSCHGRREYGSVSLQFQTQEGMIVNSKMLQERIMALPEHCTLEVVVDTCFAEGVIPGLRRILSASPPAPCGMLAGMFSYDATHSSPSGSGHNTMVPSSPATSSAESSASSPTEELPIYPFPYPQVDQPKYKAQVVVWAASAEWGRPYPEANLPEKRGMYSIMIGAIFSYLSANGRNISRQEVWDNVLRAVERQNEARHERDLRKSPEDQIKLLKHDRVQIPILLTSVENSDHVLAGRLFQPIKRRSRQSSSS